MNVIMIFIFLLICFQGGYSFFNETTTWPPSQISISGTFTGVPYYRTVAQFPIHIEKAERVSGSGDDRFWGIYLKADSTHYLFVMLFVTTTTIQFYAFTDGMTTTTTVARTIPCTSGIPDTKDWFIQLSLLDAGPGVAESVGIEIFDSLGALLDSQTWLLDTTSFGVTSWSIDFLQYSASAYDSRNSDTEFPDAIKYAPVQGGNQLPLGKLLEPSLYGVNVTRFKFGDDV